MEQNTVDTTRPEHSAPQTPQSIGVRKKRWVVCFENTILDLDLSIYEKMVYIVLCAHAKKDGPCYLSVRKIAEEASYSRAKVFEALKTLEERGIIVRSSQIYKGRGQTSKIVDIEPRPQGEPPRPCDGRPGTPDGHRSPHDGRGSTQGGHPPSTVCMGPVREPDAVEQGNNKQDHKNNIKELPPTPQATQRVGEGDGDFQNSKSQNPKPDTEEKDGSTEPPGSSQESINDAILAAYNKILPELPRAEVLTASRSQTLITRISEDSARQEPDWWNRFFERVRLFPWLMGNNPNNWRASFDWLTGGDGMRKVIEGSFTQAQTPSRDNGDSAEEFLKWQEKYTDERGFINARALLREWKARPARS